MGVLDWYVLVKKGLSIDIYYIVYNKNKCKFAQSRSPLKFALIPASIFILFQKAIHSNTNCQALFDSLFAILVWFAYLNT